VQLASTVLDSDKRPGELSHFTCPECAGPPYEMQRDDLIRFRCRVGHAYTAGSMLDEKSEELEHALYFALDALEENTLMTDRLTNRSRGHGCAVVRFEQRAQEARQQAKVVRRVLTQDTSEAARSATLPRLRPGCPAPRARGPESGPSSRRSSRP
jgi:two-component system, chemotaxis family, protein-glutamate methylesterase/glutaminase